MHTNDAPSTITRLADLGIERFLVATSATLVCAQRLVRRICARCKESVAVPEEALIDLGFLPEEAQIGRLFRGAGCEECSKTGYRGRIGLYEVMEITTDVRKMIIAGASATELKDHAVQQGMETLRRNGLRKMLQGITTLEEVLRETVAYTGRREPTTALARKL